MTIIDQKGRLFGKVNLLDLIVVLAVLGVAGWFGYKTFFEPEKAVGNQTVEVEFLVARVRSATIEQLQVTNPPTQIFDAKSGALLGTIVAVRTQPARVLGDQSEFVAETYFDHYITVRGMGIVSDAGTTLGGIPMLVGEQPLKTATWKGIATTWDLTPERK